MQLKLKLQLKLYPSIKYTKHT